MNRQYEFAKLYYDWIVKCLTKDEQWEVLAYFVLGCELCVRQKELMSIEWNQIEFPYVNNIRISKVKPTGAVEFYPPKEISKNTMDLLNKTWNRRSIKLFNKEQYYYIYRIRESCGDSTFNGHVMRTLGIQFKSNNIN